MTAPERLMPPREVARLFGVDPKTVLRWGKAGLVPSVVTPSGRRVYPAAAIREMAAVKQPRRYARKTP